MEREDIINDLNDFKNLLRHDPKLLIRILHEGYPEKYTNVFNILCTNQDFQNTFELYRKIITEVY